MKDFETLHKTETGTEKFVKNTVFLTDEMLEAGFVYREPYKVDENSTEILKQKQALAEKLCKHIKVFTIS